MDLDNLAFASLDEQIYGCIEPPILDDGLSFDELISIGNTYARKYYYQEAMYCYAKASELKPDDWMTSYRVATCALTLRQFEEAEKRFEECLAHGASTSDIAYAYGVLHYLKKDYSRAFVLFSLHRTSDDADAVSVLYWLTICLMRQNDLWKKVPSLSFEQDLGHHESYRDGLSVLMAKETYDYDPDSLDEHQDLDNVIFLYAVYIRHLADGKPDAGSVLEKILTYSSVWPSIAYLAAYNDSLEER